VGIYSREQLTREVHQLFSQKLTIQVDSPRQDLFQTGVLDSTTMVQLLLQLEERFGLPFPIEEIGADSFGSVEKIAELIARRRASGTAKPLAPIPIGPPGGGKDLVNVIQGLFVEKMAIKVDSVDADLFETGVFDSMTLVEFIVHLEQHFNLRFPMQDLELDSILSIVKLSELVNNAMHTAGNGF